MSILSIFKANEEKKHYQEFKTMRKDLEKVLYAAAIAEHEQPKNETQAREVFFEEQRSWNRFVDCQLENSLIRPKSEKDMAERGVAIERLCEALSSPRLSAIALYAAPLTAANRIIRNASINTLTDHKTDYGTSPNTTGYIDVTTRNADAGKIQEECKNIFSSEYLPAGCIFVLCPNNLYWHNGQYEVKDVDLASNPATLVAVITTSESAEIIKHWMTERGLDASKVCTFEDCKSAIGKDNIEVNHDEERC